MVDAHLASVSAADDAAFNALRDLSGVLHDKEATGIVGGHMVSLLTAAFPSPGFVPRRTNDADGGVPKALASSGEIHDRLLALDYEPAGGNRYIRERTDGTEQALDILVPNLDVRLGAETIGGRRFDSMPGLGLALANRLSVDVFATLSSGEELQFSTHVPSVEGAVILKAYAWSGRLALKDAVDLHNLFRIIESHGSDTVGGWRLDEALPVGARAHTSRILHNLARNWEARPPKVTFDSRQLVSSIRTRVAPPREVRRRD